MANALIHRSYVQTGAHSQVNIYDKKTVFDAGDNFFIVTLPNINRSKHDRINDRLTAHISDLGLEILRTVSSNPGINAIALTDVLAKEDKSVNKDMIYNTIKRQLKDYIEHRGSKKTGGYYLK